ncbi:EsaB/YukD family protein [Gordonia sp. CPCC 205333]|uniref:EsaB/YukD family protein n=1 Tax=Gordonia sp. CPCC 205333 TaxID=3140790 RepID=UPI003AF3A727
MGATFVRLTVLADDSQLDISLPAHRPVVEYIDDVVAMFGPSAAAPTTAWALSLPTHGPIELDDTLADHSIADGVTLHLTKAPDAAPPPFVDDVIAEMRRTVDDRYERWTAQSRRVWLSAVLAGVLLSGAGFVALQSSDTAVAGGLAVLALVTIAIGTFARGKPLGYVTWAAAPIGGLAVWRATQSVGVAESVSWAFATGALIAALATYTSLDSRSLTLAGGLVGGSLYVAGGAFALGANPTALSVWASIGLVVVTIFTPRLALSSSGLLAQIQRSEQLELAERAAVEKGLHRGREVVDGLVWAASALLIPVVAIIAGTGVWEQGVVAVLLVLIFTLRSRSFTHSRHVAPMLGASAVSAVVVVCAVPHWIELTQAAAIIAGVVGTIIVGIAVLIGQLPALDEVPAARLRRFLDGVDLPLALAYFPVVFVGQGVYGLFWPY